jgi:hypothetical protein
MNDPRGLQASFNASSRDQWSSFAGHRERVTALLAAGANASCTRLCILGAGNTNDLDLPVLLNAYREVDLVDLDALALADGAARQGVSAHPALRLIGGVDLTGMLDAMGYWTPQTNVTSADLAALVQWPSSRVAPTLRGSYDVVASTCLLSQIVGNAFRAVGDRHPRFPALVQAIRLGHLRLLSQLAGPGRSAILINDLTSSDFFPALKSHPDASLSELLPRIAKEHRFIHGADPAAIQAALRNDADLAARVERAETTFPWRWHLHNRDYLVRAMTLWNRTVLAPARSTVLWH